MTPNQLIDRLLKSEEASIRWKTRVNVLGEDRDSAAIKKLETEVKNSPRVIALLQKMEANGRMKVNVYAKWQGAQWMFMTLADIGFPKGNKKLLPEMDEVIRTWLGDRFFNEFKAETKEDAYKK